MSGAFQLDFPYRVDTQDARVITMNGGTSTCQNGVLGVTCGTQQWSGAGMQGRFPLAAIGNKEFSIDFTAIFDSNACPGTLQIVGIGDGERGVFVGYNGAQFGVRLLLGGKMQFYVLSLTNSASASGQLVVTLNGTSFAYTIASGQSIMSILSQVAGDPRLVAANMTTCIVNNGVYIVTALAFPPSSPCALTDTGTGTSATLNQIITGVAPVDQWVYSQDWNGPGLSKPTTINFSAGNTYRIRLTPLGFGTVTVSVLDPVSMAFTDLNTFTRANSAQNLVFLGQGLVPSMYSCNFIGNTSLTVQSTGFLVSAGPNSILPARIRPPYCAAVNCISITLNNSPTTLLNLQNMLVINNTKNTKVINLNTVTINVTSAQPCQVACWKDAVFQAPLAGVASDNNSSVLVDNVSRVSVQSGNLLHNWLVPNSFTASGLDMSDCWAEPGCSLTFTLNMLNQTVSTPVTSTLTSSSQVATVGICVTWCQT